MIFMFDLLLFVCPEFEGDGGNYDSRALLSVNTDDNTSHYRTFVNDFQEQK